MHLWKEVGGDGWEVKRFVEARRGHKSPPEPIHVLNIYQHVIRLFLYIIIGCSGADRAPGGRHGAGHAASDPGLPPNEEGRAGEARLSQHSYCLYCKLNGITIHLSVVYFLLCANTLFAPQFLEFGRFFRFFFSPNPPTLSKHYPTLSTGTSVWIRCVR